MYHIGYVHRFDGNEFATYEEAEKAAKTRAVGGYEMWIAKDTAHVLPEETLTVTVSL